MDAALATKVAASFVVAGAWISSATLLSERLGARTGGLVGNLPSNILVAFVFVALTQGTAFAAEATRAVPAGMAVDAAFLLVFVLALARGLPAAGVLSLVTWFALAVLAGRVGSGSLAWSIPVFVAATLGAFLLLDRVARVRTVAAAPRSYGPGEMLARASFAGTVVATTVLASGFVGPYWTGLLGTFPAVLLTTLVILARKQGPEFARGAGKVLVLASSNIVVYALVVGWAYPAVGVWAGTPLALAAAVTWVALLRPVVNRVA